MDNLENLIEVREVSRCFKTGKEDFYALRNVNISVKKGELTMLKGRSGSGKTTLLNIISALDEPTTGDVIFDGKSYSGLSEKEKESLRRYRMGFVFQSLALVPFMNSYENVDFGLRLAGVKDAKERDQRIKKVLSMVGMSDRSEHMPIQMSGGEQQRIAIARAIAHKPDVLIADEPTGALDTENGLIVMKLFQELTKAEGITIVMTSHDPNLIELCNNVYEMEGGVLSEV